jgi:hypothetical protein
MVSFIHEGLLFLVRDRPRFAADLLTELLGVELPPFTDARMTEAKLTELMPVEYQADAVVLLVGDGAPVHGIIVEAQLRRDDRKLYTWPLYAVAARARHECAFTSIVVTPDRGVAAWAAQPVELGNDMVFRSRVIGPDGIPKITRVEDARLEPQLAVLSAIAHGNDDPETAVHIARVATAGASHLPHDQQLLYSSLIRRALGDAARKAFDMIHLDPQKYIDEWRDDIAAEAELRGMATGQAKSVIKILEQRKLAVTDDQRQRILDCGDLPTLDRWLTQAITAAVVDELFR